MRNLNLPKEFYTINENLHKRFNEIGESIPDLWTRYEGDKLPPMVKEIYEDLFSPENYSGTEMGVFEGWQGLELIKNAMVMGYLWGKNEPEFKALQQEWEEVYLLMKKLEYRVKVDGREFLPLVMEDVAPAADGSLTWSNSKLLDKSTAVRTQYLEFMNKLPLWIKEVEEAIDRGEFNKFR